jgi:DNA modification methylase
MRKMEERAGASALTSRGFSIKKSGGSPEKGVRPAMYPRQPTLFPAEELLDANSVRELNNMGLVHRWYNYVQDFPPGLIWEKLDEYNIGSGHLVLDPFVGGGTTLVVAKLRGVESVGSEVNPLMALVSRVKTTWDINASQINFMGQNLISRAQARLEAKERALEGDLFQVPQRSLSKWLSPAIQREAQALQAEIRGLRDGPEKDLLRLAYGRALFKSSNVKLCPGITFIKDRRVMPLLVNFEQHLALMSADLRILQHFDDYGKATVIDADARRLSSAVADESVDLIVTSPPYPGDVEYTRQTRLEMFALGFIKDLEDVKAIKRRMLRSSAKNIWKDDNHADLVKDFTVIRRISEDIALRVADKDWGWDYPRMVREYFGDMLLCLEEFRKVLKPRGHCLLIVGDQTVKGVLIPVGKILSALGKRVGFKPVTIECYRLRRSSIHRTPLPENIVVIQRV